MLPEQLRSNLIETISEVIWERRERPREAERCGAAREEGSPLTPVAETQHKGLQRMPTVTRELQNPTKKL